MKGLKIVRFVALHFLSFPIQVISGKIEEIELPEQVDIIIREVPPQFSYKKNLSSLHNSFRHSDRFFIEFRLFGFLS
jgi:hypothetical protein